jgi:hypothetical protein
MDEPSRDKPSSARLVSSPSRGGVLDDKKGEKEAKDYNVGKNINNFGPFRASLGTRFPTEFLFSKGN